MKKDLTIGGIGARSTSVRRRIMKRVCKENVSGVKTNIVLSDIADIDPRFLPTFIIGILKKDTIIPNGKTLTINDNETLFIETSKTLVNYGTIINNGGSQGGIYIVDLLTLFTPPTGGGGTLENNGTIINQSFITNKNILINKGIIITRNPTATENGQLNNMGSLTNTQAIYVSNGGTMINTGTITNTGTINIANGSGVCGFGHFDVSGSYAGQPIGNACPFR